MATILRNILRQDPDVIMVGEIRDKETAEIAIRAALTGHLVISTIHTNDAVTAISRLADMGIDPFLISIKLPGKATQRFNISFFSSTGCSVSEGRLKARISFCLMEV